MRVTQGDLWDYRDTHRVVVPVNIGWTQVGENPMGRGVAKQAADRFPDLPAKYGNVCEHYRAVTPVVEFGVIAGRLEVRSTLTEPDPITRRGVILFPTKPLNVDAPHLSWRGPASLELIERGARQLAAGWSQVPVALPLVGCANGRLRDVDVIPILERYLTGDNFLLVLR